MATQSDFPPGVDPRLGPNGEAASTADEGVLHPAVSNSGADPAVWLIGGGAALVGVVAFLVLSNHRARTPNEAPPAPPLSEAVLSPDTPPAAIDQMEAASRGIGPPPALAVVTPPPAAPVQTPTPIAAAPPAPTDTSAAAKAPVLVVDLAPSGSTAPTPATPAPAAGDANAKGGDAAKGAANASGLNADEQFAARIESSAEPERARATMLRHQSTVVPEGAMIPAVLETALNSDLPGYARAVVSRDVRSFDGSRVLIPRGSRVIGEYRSAVALGQSRAFVIWTRVLRPDGASIQIASSGGDPLGRAGLAGSVDRHFFERFGGAVLLTVLNLGATVLADHSTTTVVVGSSSEATSLASSVSAFTPANISPTIKVPQGSPLRIFVARDLDFTSVEGRGG